MRFPRGALGLILFAGLQFASPSGLFAQSPPPSLVVVIRFGQGQELSLTSQQGIVPTVALLPSQSVTLTLRFSSGKVGEAVMVGAYDGGQISGIQQVVFVPADGAVPFTFQAGTQTGDYRIVVQIGAEQHLLQFRVKSPAG
jgi:hypothetical protein